MEALTTQKIFKNLEGKWNFSRLIKDRLAGTEHTANGEVIFSKIKETQLEQLNYFEKGKLHFSPIKKEIDFERKYIFKLVQDEIHIVFDDGISKGKLYQKLIPNDAENASFVGTEHLCVNDLYQGQYAFPNEDEFIIRYYIKGPNKEIEIETVFRKVNI